MKEYEAIQDFAADFLKGGKITTTRSQARGGFVGYSESIGAVSFSVETPSEQIRFLKARTDTRQFKEVGRQAVICFIKGRVRFPGEKSGAPFPSMLAYLGERRADFIAACKDQDIGDCYVWDPVEATE